MLWVITTAAIGVGGVLYELGAMSVWLAVLSLALKASTLVAAAALLAFVIRYALRRRVR